MATNNSGKTLSGGQADERLVGGDGDDRLYGKGGNDELHGMDGNDVLSGGTGDDYLLGDNENFDFFSGDDTYLFAQHDGRDRIWDEGGNDVVRFTDVAAADIIEAVRVNDWDLRLTHHTGDQLIIIGYFSLEYRALGLGLKFAEYRHQIEAFRFSDGVTWTWQDIKAKNPVPTGTNRDDLLAGFNDEDDALNGGAGDDALHGYGGNDRLDGGGGNDQLHGDNGDDAYLIAKNSGQDSIYEYGGDDVVIFSDIASTDILQVNRVGAARDELLLVYGSGQQLSVSGFFDDRFAFKLYQIERFQFSDGVEWTFADVAAKASQATENTDVLYTDFEHPTVKGLAGNDRLYGDSGRNFLYGGAGSDSLDGGGGNDVLKGNIGKDRLTGGFGDDVLDGGSGEDWAQYREALGPVTVSLDARQNTGGAGIDTLINIENLSGSQYGDRLVGDFYANKLMGGLGDDSLCGYGDDDTLKGGLGRDTLQGGDGGDILNGGYGRDELTGGQGRDTFVFNTALSDDTRDIIIDFNAEDDSIGLARKVFTKLTQTGPLADAAFKLIGSGQNFDTVDADDRIVYLQTYGKLYYDPDGAGSKTAAMIALLGQGAPLTAADFIVI